MISLDKGTIDLQVCAVRKRPRLAAVCSRCHLQHLPALPQCCNYLCRPDQLFVSDNAALVPSQKLHTRFFCAPAPSLQVLSAAVSSVYMINLYC